MEGAMVSIEEYLRSHNCDVRVPFASIIRKAIIVQTYDDYLKYETPDDEMIARMLHLPPDKKLHNGLSA